MKGYRKLQRYCSFGAMKGGSALERLQQRKTAKKLFLTSQTSQGKHHSSEVKTRLSKAEGPSAIPHTAPFMRSPTNHLERHRRNIQIVKERTDSLPFQILHCKAVLGAMVTVHLIIIFN
jgi:hypothetical protein